MSHAVAHMLLLQREFRWFEIHIYACCFFNHEIKFWLGNCSFLPSIRNFLLIYWQLVIGCRRWREVFSIWCRHILRLEKRYCTPSILEPRHELLEKCESWMKNTFNSCTLVAALIGPIAPLEVPTTKDLQSFWYRKLCVLLPLLLPCWFSYPSYCHTLLEEILFNQLQELSLLDYILYCRNAPTTRICYWIGK